MRRAAAALLVSACGGDPAAAPIDAPRYGDCGCPADAAIDAGPFANPGFVPPDDPVTGDWSCLGAPGPGPTTVAVSLTGRAVDFQDGAPLAGAAISAFTGVAHQAPFDVDGPTSPSGGWTIDVPSGTGRIGLAVTLPADYAETLSVGVGLVPDDPTQARDAVAVSRAVRDALAAVVGVDLSPGIVVAFGAVRDCAGVPVAHAIGTVSGTSGVAAHLPRAVTYYIDEGTGLPVRHDQQLVTEDGRFLVLEVEVAVTAFLQAWGRLDPGGALTLLAEVPVPLIDDSVLVGELAPRRD